MFGSSNDFIPSGNDSIPSGNDFIPSGNDFIASSNDFIASSNDFIASSKDSIASSKDSIASRNDFIACIKTADLEAQNAPKSAEQAQNEWSRLETGNFLLNWPIWQAAADVSPPIIPAGGKVGAGQSSARRTSERKDRRARSDAPYQPHSECRWGNGADVAASRQSAANCDGIFKMAAFCRKPLRRTRSWAMTGIKLP